MTSPIVQGRGATQGSANALAMTCALPTAIVRDELLFVTFSVDGAGALIFGSGFSGWTLLQESSSTGVKLATAYKVADGTESADLSIALIAAETWCAASWRISGSDLNVPPAFVASGSAGSVDPNPPALAYPWNVLDTLVIAAAAGDGDGAFTAGPSGYGNVRHQLATNATTTDRVALSVAELATTGVSTQDPGVFTRASAAWQAATYAMRAPPTTPTKQRIVVSKTVVATGTTATLALTQTAESNRRLVVCVGLELASTSITSVTYAGVPLTLVTDGTTSATIYQNSVALASIYSLSEASLPTDGTNNVVVAVNNSTDITVTAALVARTSQTTNLAAVAVAGSTSTQTISASPVVAVVDSLVFGFCYKNNTDPSFDTTTIATFAAMGRGDSTTTSAGWRVAAKHLTTQTGAQAVTFTTLSTAIRMAEVAIVLSPEPAGTTVAGVGAVDIGATGVVAPVQNIVGSCAVDIRASGAVVPIQAFVGSGAVAIGANGALVPVQKVAGVGVVDIGANGFAAPVKQVAGVGVVDIGASGVVSGIRTIAGAGVVDIGATGAVSAVKQISGVAKIDIGAAGVLTQAGLEGVASIAIGATGGVVPRVSATGVASIEIGAAGGVRSQLLLFGGASVEIGAVGRVGEVRLVMGNGAIEIGAAGHINRRLPPAPGIRAAFFPKFTSRFS